MKERPILFSGPMVRALLNGSKTQTRRVVKPQFAHDAIPCEMGATNERGHQITGHSGMWWNDEEGNHEKAVRCPYGQPGGRLWVRETHAPQADCWGSWERWTRGEGGPGPIIHYAADDKKSPFIERWRPSIHMPRWASRITLEVTGVRVERLQDISVADALAEGVKTHPDHHRKPRESIYSPVQDYRDLWESINGPDSWDANPWVWAVSFKRVEGGAA